MAQWYEHLTNIQTDPATSNPGWSPTVHFIIHSMNIRTDSSLCNGASVLEPDSFASTDISFTCIEFPLYLAFVPYFHIHCWCNHDSSHVLYMCSHLA